MSSSFIQNFISDIKVSNSPSFARISSYLLTPARYLLGGRDICLIRGAVKENDYTLLISKRISSKAFSQEGRRNWTKCACMLLLSPFSILGALTRSIDYYFNNNTHIYKQVFNENSNDSTLQKLNALFFQHNDSVEGTGFKDSLFNKAPFEDSPLIHTSSSHLDSSLESSTLPYVPVSPPHDSSEGTSLCSYHTQKISPTLNKRIINYFMPNGSFGIALTYLEENFMGIRSITYTNNCKGLEIEKAIKEIKKTLPDISLDSVNSL